MNFLINHSNEFICKTKPRQGVCTSTFNTVIMNIVIMLMGIIFISGMTLSMFAQQTQTPPTVEQLMEESLNAMGGKTAVEKIHNRYYKATLEIKGTGVVAFITYYQALPNKYFIITESNVMGKVVSGSNGDVVWENSVMNGAQIKEGDERAYDLLVNRLDIELNWRTIYKKVELNGEEIVQGKPCYKLTFTPKEGEPIINFLDKESKLPIKSTQRYTNREGTFVLDISYNEYKSFDGIMVATKISYPMMGQEYFFTIENIQHNVDMPEDRFQLPDEIKALLKKK